MKARKIALVSAVLSTGFAALHAQVVEGKNVPSATTAESPVELSPFVVSSTQDTGYLAASTLAGTRLNTPLKDLGASISVYSKNFLNDIGATNPSELFVYATSMEAGGAGGNFTGATNDSSFQNPSNGIIQTEPQGVSRSRGLAAPSFTRGLFPSSIPMDSYNTDAVTVNRGANGILFGTGSPAGVVDTSLIQADTSRDRNTVVARYGNNDSLRASIDLNRVLIPQKLALRIAALRDRNEFNQRPAFEDKSRIYGAVAYRPARSTALRASFESGNTLANRPQTILPFDSVSLWTESGRPSFDWTFYDDPARNPSAAVQNAGTVVPLGIALNQINQNSVVLVYNNPGDTSPAYSFVTTLPSTAGTAANAIKTQIFNPIVNRDLAADTIGFWSSPNFGEIAGGLWTADLLAKYNLQALGNVPGLVPAGRKFFGFRNYDVFNFAKHQIYESGRQRESFHAFDVALEQRAWRDRVGVELAYHAERYDTHDNRDLMFGTTSSPIRIDTNVTLPNGQPNPNLGRPFMLSGQQNYGETFTKRESFRATAFLRYDFKDLGPTWGRWLGRHVLTGLYQQKATDQISNAFRFASDGEASLAISPNIGSLGRIRPAEIIYVGPSLIGNNNPLRLQPVKIPLLQAGPVAVPLSATSYFSRAAGATDPGTFRSAPVSLVEIIAGGTLSRDVIKSQAAVLQSYWLKEYLITTVGWSRDEDYLGRRTVTFVPNPANPNDPGKAHYSFSDLSFPRTPPRLAAGEGLSWSAVLRWPTRLPKGVDFRLFFNKSSNFAPAGGAFNGFFEPLPSQRGKTKEFGFNLSAFAEKLTIRFNTFQTNQTNVKIDPGFLGVMYNFFILPADYWSTEANINPQLAAQRNADLQLLLSGVPSNFLDLWNWKLVGTAPNLTTTHPQNISSGSDTTDYSAKGLEMDIVFNPTANWRIMANVSKQESVQTNILPFLQKLIVKMTPIWDKLGGVPYANYPEGWQPGDPIPANFQLFRDRLNTDFFVPYASYAAAAGTRSAEQRKWRANLVTSYTFSRESPFGPALRGWSIGAGVRWQERAAIGYPYRLKADRSVSIDVAHPYYGPPETNVDGWIGYGRKLWQNRINWKVRLNATNLIGDTSPIPINTQPWGEIASVRIPPEKRWYLTNTFDF